MAWEGDGVGKGANGATGFGKNERFGGNGVVEFFGMFGPIATNAVNCANVVGVNDDVLQVRCHDNLSLIGFGCR